MADDFQEKGIDELMFAEPNIQPYQYEPLVGANAGESSESSESEDENDANFARAGNTDWCMCGNCEVMTTGRESICCQDITPIDTIAEEADLGCITDHEVFKANCLNRHVIQVSVYEFVFLEGPLNDDDPIHKTYRYVAYRRFARWIWHRLAKNHRKFLPSCAVSKIRNAFPSELYTGFKYARP